MRTLSTAELLNVWEWGLNCSPVKRALLLLEAACPEIPSEELAQLSLGQRDEQLLRLREQTFGSQLVSVVSCPSCGDRLELNFRVDEIGVASPPAFSEELLLELDECEVRFRLPNSADLLAIAAYRDPAVARQALLSACLLSVCVRGEVCSVNQLPASAAEAVVEKMAEADPQADVQLELSCPACAHQWQSAFDILSFFWTEIDAWAKRTLWEVHTLASAYSWREAEILALSFRRRQLYLEMVGL